MREQQHHDHQLLCSDGCTTTHCVRCGVLCVFDFLLRSVLMLPPYIIAFMNKTALVKANPRLKLPIELCKHTVVLGGL